MPPLAVPPPPAIAPAVSGRQARETAIPPVRRTRPARMLVYASEFRLNPSRLVVPTGLLIVQVRNIGEDDHDLAIRRADGHILAKTPEILPGEGAELRVRLRPGRYWLVCTIPDHEGHGMVTAFTVKKPAKPRRR